MQRAYQQAFTSLDLGRRQWKKLSDRGRHALVSCTNSSLKLAFSDGKHMPRGLRQCTAVRRGVANRALQQQATSQAELYLLMQV